SCTSRAPTTARAARVACSRLDFAKSSWSAITRSVESMEMRVRRAAVSTVALLISDSGLATVGIALGSSFGSVGHGAIGAPQQFHSRKRGPPCQGIFGALHQTPI